MNISNLFHLLSYGILRFLLFPLSLLPYFALHKVGEKLGIAFFYLLPKYRKRILSNLALATDLSIKNKDLPFLAKRALGSLIITCLEYGKLSREKNISHLASCINPTKAADLLSEGKGLIFFCGHQANWELFFLEGTLRMPGVAIGQPVKNPYLYRWVLRIREKFGGKIITPSQAVKEGLRALKQGKFLGIVGDQAMPESGFYAPFLGRPAFTSTLPALLSYRSGRPILTATMTRKDGSYHICYSDPIWPELNKSAEEEIPRLMKEVLKPLEDSIKLLPTQWLWSHNRWKQQKPGKLKKLYRQDAIAIILPKEKPLWEKLSAELHSFRTYYPRELLAFFTPYPLSENLQQEEIHLYQEYEDIKIEDFRFKLLFNLTAEKSLNKHFLKLSVIHAVTLKELEQRAKSSLLSLHDLLSRTIL
jgi:Kdo2-lipid IVA lauroyltransferase/acyltransferase